VGLHQVEELRGCIRAGALTGEEAKLLSNELLEADPPAPRQGSRLLQEVVFHGDRHVHEHSLRGHGIRVKRRPKQGGKGLTAWRGKVPAPGKAAAAAHTVDACRGVYYRMTMPRRGEKSSVLTIRVGPELSRSLAGEARRRRTTKSELVRELLAAGLEGERGVPDLAEEARRQSLLVSERESEREALEFLKHAADTRGWR
jgi:hypothetical protein